ncbi:MAG TPA: DUF4215 domain-containing protein, partial [Polyangiaceae bacterium]|nr:DUF4215 domain-containing protein [Polyangiaceae bacterium]
MKGLNLHGTRRARMFEWHRIALFACAASLGCSPSGSEPSSAHENTGRDRGGTSGASSGGKGAGGSTGIALGGAVNSAGEASATGGCPEPSACRVGCGNGRLELGLGETCDDGNDRAGDGCSADCRIVETNFVCPEPGRPCLNLVRCGDGKLAGGETCDDGNVTGGDGCSAGCEIEPGFDCISEGARCTPHCGDGALKGDEQCDAPNGGKGCGVGCRLEPGFVCAPPQGGPAMCHATVCGDRLREGAEACDDGNALDGDGCSAACALEPECSGGACVPRCGDQLRISPEECDDGNNVDGDGCDRACRIENGFSCAENAASLPNSLNLTVTYRDFVSFPIADLPRHPDFESAFAADERTPGLVRAELGADGKPQLEGRCSSEQPSTSSDRSICPYGQMLTT